MKQIICATLWLISITFIAFSDYYYITYTCPQGSDMTSIAGNEDVIVTSPAGTNLSNVTVKSMVCANSQSLNNSQTVSGFSFTYSTTPTSSTNSADLYGNNYTSATWATITSGNSAKMIRSYSASTKVAMSGFLPSDIFPRAGSLPTEVSQYLGATSKIQSGDATIISTATTIVGSSTTMHQAVTKLAQWIYDNISYYDDPTMAYSQDAKNVLTNKKGNCEGYTNLIIAFFRAKNIPARVCTGILLNKQQTLLIGTNGSVTIGGGGPGWHAIYEVYYPSMSKWVLADPQSSVHFNTNHTLVFGKGLDANDCKTTACNYSTSGSPATFTSNINTTVATITSGATAYVFDKMQTITSSQKASGCFFGVKEVLGNTGIEDGVTITSGIFTFTSPSQSAAYQSVFTDRPPLSYMGTWNWKLVFYSNTTIWTAAAANISSLNSSTWNVPGFTLPSSGYQWLYDENGHIMGNVSVEGYDSDNIYHKDSRAVTYSVSNPYPMDVYYVNKTISTMQPEVKAHNLVSLTNDNLLSGTNISFKSGKTININNSVTIQNGTSTNFIVDPTLRQ